MRRTFWIVGLLFISICVVLAALYVAYRKYPEVTALEPYRKAIDDRLSQWWKTKQWQYKPINTYVFGNGKMYIFRPPRIMPNPNGKGGQDGYVLYGLFEQWDPQSKLLKVHAYTGESMWVKFDPETHGTIAVFPKLDKYGVAQGLNMRFVNSSNDTFWQTMFCQGDVLAIYTPSIPAYATSSQFPIVPTHIDLSFRLCSTN